MRTFKRAKYIKRLDVPKEEVLQKRKERKEARQRSILLRKPKVKTRMGVDESHGIRKFKFRIRKDQKCTTHEETGFRMTISDSKVWTSYCVNVSMISQNYVDWFWARMKADSYDLRLSLQLFPNVKEISESVGAFFAMIKHYPNLKESTVIVVADGSTPRTGFLVAQAVRTVYSIDPLMKDEWVMDDLKLLPKNLNVLKCRIEDFDLQLLSEPCLTKQLVILAVHAHVGFEAYLDKLLASTNVEECLIVAIPCCQPLEIDVVTCNKWNLQKLPTKIDYHILSPCRTVEVWKLDAHTKPPTQGVNNIIHIEA